MIRFHDINGNAVTINPEQITFTYVLGNETRICLVGRKEPIDVIEDESEVVRKIIEYKSAVRHHQAAINNDDLDLAVMHEQSLNELAGLEESPDAK